MTRGTIPDLFSLVFPGDGSSLSITYLTSNYVYLLIFHYTVTIFFQYSVHNHLVSFFGKYQTSLSLLFPKRLLHCNSKILK